MKTYIALFRGINVGGHNILAMKELVILLDELGCTGVRSYIQSGNAVFRHRAAAPGLTKRIRATVKAAKGFEPVPKKPDLDSLNELCSNTERFKLEKDVFYMHAPDGIGRSKLAAKVERALGVPTTGRNWRTVQKILELALAICVTVILGCAQKTESVADAESQSAAAFGVRSVTAERIVNADDEPGNWLSTGRTYDEQRFSPLAKINENNVGDLGLAWHFDIDTNRAMEATPLVADGVMYVTQPWSIVYALNAATGEPIWTYDPQTPRSWGVYACCDVPNRGVALWNDKVYVATFDGYLIALDAATGVEVWKADTIDRTPPFSITGAPRVVEGKVIIGNGGAEYGVRGYVSAYDADSGERLWKTYTVPGNPADDFESDAMAMAAEAWSGQWWKLGGGGTAWDAFAYDPELDLLYVGVGNGAPWNREVRSPGGGDNLFLASILALDPDNGEYVWHYQTTPGETWDYTATQHMILANLMIDGTERQVLMQAPKNGFFYVLDRATGKLISADPYIALNWATHVDPDGGRPVEVPGSRYEEAHWVLFPGAAGGHNWQPMSFNPMTGLVYIPVIGGPEAFANNPVVFEFVGSQLNTGIDVSVVAETPAEEIAEIPSVLARVSAWDPVRRKEVFRIDSANGWNAGLLSTAGNLIFQGEATGEFAAYRADTGDQLWSAFAGTGIQAAPATYEVNGEQYVSVLGGWGASLGAYTGDPGPRANLEAIGRVLTYKLGSSESLPPASVVELRIPDIEDTGASSETINRGKAMFLHRCSWCHGVDTIGIGSFPDLRYSGVEIHSIWNEIVLDGAFLAKGMPSFRDVYDEEDAQAIRAYVVRQGRLTLGAGAE